MAYVKCRWFRVWHKLCERLLYLRIPDTWRKVPRADVLLVSADGNRRKTPDDKYFEPYMDPLGRELANRGVNLAFLTLPYGGIAPSLLPHNYVSLNRLLFACNFLGYIFGSSFRSFCLNQAYKCVIKRANCQVIAGPNLPPELCKAAQSMGVPTAEIQHGLCWVDECLQSTRPDEQPTYWVTFDSITSETFRRSENFRNRVVEVARPSASRGPDSGSPGVSDTLVGGLLGARYPMRVLVTLDWFGAPLFVDSLNMENRELDVLDFWRARVLPLSERLQLDQTFQRAIADSSVTTFWFIRFHPLTLSNQYWRRLYSRAKSLLAQYANVDLDWATESDLHQAIQASNRHVTRASMSSYDAALLNVPTLIFQRLGDEDVLRLRSAKKLVDYVGATVFSANNSEFKDLGEAIDKAKSVRRDFNVFTEQTHQRLVDLIQSFVHPRL